MICSICSAVRALSTNTRDLDKRGRIDLEGRVFGGGADKNHRPILDVGEDHVLLRLVEAMNLVDEQDRPPPLHAEAVLSLPNDGAKVRHSQTRPR